MSHAYSRERGIHSMPPGSATASPLTGPHATRWRYPRPSRTETTAHSQALHTSLGGLTEGTLCDFVSCRGKSWCASLSGGSLKNVNDVHHSQS